MQWPQQPNQPGAQRFPPATPPVSAAAGAQLPRYGVPPAQGSPAPMSQPQGQGPTPMPSYPPQPG
jgi:hypothetical protein